MIPGGFEKSKRYSLSARKGLVFLKRCQQDDGSFPVKGATRDAKIAAASMAGIAFLAGTQLPKGDAYRPCLEKCLQFVRESLEGADAGPMGAAYGVFFLAEIFQKRNVKEKEFASQDKKESIENILLEFSEEISGLVNNENLKEIQKTLKGILEGLI